MDVEQATCTYCCALGLLEGMCYVLVQMTKCSKIMLNVLLHKILSRLKLSITCNMWVTDKSYSARCQQHLTLAVTFDFDRVNFTGFY